MNFNNMECRYRQASVVVGLATNRADSGLVLYVMCSDGRHLYILLKVLIQKTGPEAVEVRRLFMVWWFLHRIRLVRIRR